MSSRAVKAGQVTFGVARFQISKQCHRLAVCRFIPPPLGLPQRSAGLATRNAASPIPFAVFSAFPPPGPRAGRRKRGKNGEQRLKAGP